MKTVTILSMIGLLGVFCACQGQVEKEALVTEAKEDVEATDSTKRMNLLDEQTKIFGSIFSTMGEDNPLGGATNYLELLEKTEMPVEQKEHLRDMYQLYDASLDPRKKEELKVRIDKMLKEAMDKSAEQ